MATLTDAQRKALSMLDEEGSYYSSTGGPNWYHERHRPGNLYINGRTAEVLIRLGLAEIRYVRLCRTAEGTQFIREGRK